MKKTVISTRHAFPTITLIAVITLFVVLPEACYASNLDASLRGLQSKLTTVVLPVLSVIGMAIAALSFFTGNPQAKQHIVYAILGCVFGFGAQAIVDFIAQAMR